VTRTQVGIVGAGPAGLVLSHLLHRAGIASIVVEVRSRDYCEKRVRAGLLEHGSVELLKATGLGERLVREGMVHHGVSFRFNGRTHRLPYAPGVTTTIYAQQEIVKDVIAARLRDDGTIAFEVSEVAVEEIAGDRPRIRYRDRDGAAQEITCDFIAGCDGFHGICRPSIPAGFLTFYDREYPFGWLGILSESPPLEEELVYTSHERGFALFTMRSPSVTRAYLQCEPDEDIAQWPDERIWAEFRHRLDGEPQHALVEGPIFQKGVTPMRSFVTEPMQYGRLFLAGDAAHIVPPTGAKGMNLAIADVNLLAHAFAAYYADGDREGLDRYSEIALRRVWKAQRFSWWMTKTLHRFADQSPFDHQIQLAELDYVTSSEAGTRSVVENYAGLPFEVPTRVSAIS
jgi:p-hydroxybenzoate 3-monooxygenase